MSTPEPQPLLVPHELDALTDVLNLHIEKIALGHADIGNAALQAAKFVFDLSLETEKVSKKPIDDLLNSLNPLQAPQTRSQIKGNGSTQSSPPATREFESTPLSSLFVDGMDSEQIWMQLDLRCQNICKLLDFTLEGGTGKNDDDAELEDEENSSQVDQEDERMHRMLEAMENGDDVDFEALQAEFGEDMEEDESEDSETETSEDNEDEDDIENDDDIENEDEILVQLRSSDEHTETNVKPTLHHSIKSRSKQKGSHGLNDGFFDIDSFNAETERAEAKSSSRGRLADDEDSEDDDMSVDLFASLGGEEVDEEETNELFYRDFFEAPRDSMGQPSHPKKNSAPVKQGRVRFHDQVRVKKIKAQGKSLPLNLIMGGIDVEEEEEEEEDEAMSTEDLDLEMDDGTYSDEEQSSSGDEERSDEDSDTEDARGDLRGTIERTKDDLFADDEDHLLDQDMTTHQKRMATLHEQIKQLEEENVAKKDWTLMGEADNRSRPQNSLLEEDLEFERVMKSVPVITEEVVQGLEQRIKTRILENQFDDVVRVRPLEDKPFLPSRLLELQDTKSTQSLAQIYENDYLESQGQLADDRDGKLRKEHEEIDNQWEQICGKLDALCNAHFVPKQPKAVITTVSNVATAAMESALPTTRAVSTILAPEEIFNPVTSDTRTRSELSPAEKRTLRAKERKVKKKQRDTLTKSVDKLAKSSKSISSVKKEKKAALQSVVKSGKGVTVVGKHAKDLVASKKRPT